MQANGEAAAAALTLTAAAIGGSPTVSQDTRGKHRIFAELKHLEQEARFLEEELDKLNRIENVSASLQLLLHRIENSPDPLLPITSGPTIYVVGSVVRTASGLAWL
ncbi:Guanine nucleotide-binding protein subunit gamma 2 [Platanthera guangdongensis]|uniref:Guanine nucleotide-binding protein subunit gamma 2 n=1 Tax=Platanthera guangdongensis TaxID=2320717 RepID=A0ABR2MBR5_9ASPA